MAPTVVIIGAGVVGAALADELTARGWTDVTVLDQGPLDPTPRDGARVPLPGGSTSHAPGLVFQANPSRTMTGFARYTVETLSGLTHDGLWCFNQVGGLEVATTPERFTDLRRRHGWLTSCGVPSRLVDPDECAALHPLLRADRVLGGLHTPTDGLAKAPRAVAAQLARAVDRGARVVGNARVTAVRTAQGRVTGVAVTTASGTDEIRADVVVSATGFWGPRTGALVDLTIPLLPMAHQYARTSPIPALTGRTTVEQEATAPILRHQDRDLYFREHVDRLGIGSYAHRPMPVDLAAVAEPGGPESDQHSMPSSLEFTPVDFAPSWADTVALLPDADGAKVTEAFNGIFSFTPDGLPLLGEHPALRGFWVAEAVWVTASAGVGRAMAQWLVDGQPEADVHECDLARFEEAQLTPEYVTERGAQGFAEVYDILHPLDPPASLRPLRTSPFHPRQVALGAVFEQVAGWERPLWFTANDDLPGAAPARDPWAARNWSPTAAAEALATRDRVAMYDMTPLKRLEVTGPGALALLQRLTTNEMDKKVGRVTYTLLLEPTGGVRSDLTVARLGEQRFQVGCNGNLDLDRLRREAGPDVHLADITGATCCVGLWGPRARDVLAAVTRDDVSSAFGYFTAREISVAGVPVTAMRLSYVGELGWELYCSAELGLRLWDVLWDAGQRHGVIAAGRQAFNSLRLEKGYRAAGTDMTTEHDPYEAGLGFAVKAGKDFVGRDALRGRETPARRLVPLLFDDPAHVVLGKEPVYLLEEPIGYVTSAAYGYTIDASIAYAWLPATAAAPGTAVAVEYFGRRYPAVVAAEPLFDPEMKRLRG